MMALTSAALAGLDVRLLVPRESDSKLVTLAARSYFGDLLAAGVVDEGGEIGGVHTPIFTRYCSVESRTTSNSSSWAPEATGLRASPLWAARASPSRHAS